MGISISNKITLLSNLKSSLNNNIYLTNFKSEFHDENLIIEKNISGFKHILQSNNNFDVSKIIIDLINLETKQKEIVKKMEIEKNNLKDKLLNDIKNLEEEIKKDNEILALNDNLNGEKLNIERQEKISNVDKKYQK